MRKIFTSLKSVVSAVIIAAMAFSVSCSYDDTAINDRVDQVENDLKALTERVDALEKKLGAEVDALKALIDQKVVIVDVTKDEDGNAVIKLSDGSTLTVLAAENALQYRVVDGVLEVSADGETWVAVEVAPDQVVADVVLNEDGTVTVTLANGEEFTVVKAELIECEAARNGVYVLPGESKEIALSINDAVVDINIMNQPLGWSASIEEATEAPEDEGGAIAPMPLAAGGKNYVVKINAPAASFKEAAKSGVVSVHFNTAAGACKVLSVNVNVAELTLSIDKDVITLTNSIVTTTNTMMGPRTDFVDFYIGVVSKAEWDEYGYQSSTDYTMRDAGFSNVLQPLTGYVEGVTEIESYTFTAEQLQEMLWDLEFELGQSYYIYVTPDYDPQTWEPDLKKAIMVEYKNVLIKAVIDQESITTSDFAATYSLAGYDLFLIGCASMKEYEEMLSYGQFSDLGGYFEYLLTDPMMGGLNLQVGAVISSVIDTKLGLADINAASQTGSHINLAADTEYHLFVFPFNMNDIYNPSFKATADAIYDLGSFTTKPYTKGSFDPGAVFTLNNHDDESINVEVTFNENVVKATYKWFDAAALEQDARVEAVFEQMIYTFDEYTTSLEAYAGSYSFENGFPNPLYLGVIAINAAGEYVYVEKEFLYVEPEPIALTSFEYKGRHLNLDDNPETSGGDHVYIAKAVDGTELTIGLYYTYADENGVITPGEYEYCANYFDAMYSFWNGFVIVADEYYSGSRMVVTEDTVKIKVKGESTKVYLFDKNATPVVPEEPETTVASAKASLVTDTTFGGFNPYDVAFSFENGDQVIVRFNTLGTQYLHLGAWQTDSWQDPHYISQVKYNGETATITACNVAYENDAYAVTFSVFEYTNYATLNYTFTGAIEGLTAPEACDCLKEPEQPEQPEQPEGGEVEDEDYSDIFQDGTKENPYYYKATVTAGSGYYDINFHCDAEGAKSLYLSTINDVVSSIITGPIGGACGWWGGNYDSGQTNVNFDESTITVTTINSTCLSFDEIALKTDNGFVYYRCPVVKF